MLEMCPTPNPTLKLPNTVKKCKDDIKTYLLLHGIRHSSWSSSPSKYVSVLGEQPNKLTIYENP